ncbi:FAD-linked oxidase [Bryobacterales bacterium F-183]|nr:FAD-linked oxidase [Bryobacterales bacterium F-183]
MEPVTAQELADTLAAAASQRQSIKLGNTPPGVTGDVEISTSRMTGLLEYEPRDLTVSVEAGMKYSELQRLLAANNQMVPLDPPWDEEVTLAGILGANLNGPRRRLYGTARDLVIGMTFATLDGKLVKTGGMVVKNVAGLDMGKLIIGSFGTLAAIATVNFKLNPIPKESATLRFSFDSATAAFALRDRILKGQLQPAALDLLNPSASEAVQLPSAWNLLLQAVVMPERFTREYAGSTIVDDSIWRTVANFPARSSAQIIARCSTTHMGMKDLVRDGITTPVIARAASGIVYLYDPVSLPEKAPYVLERAPAGVDRWPNPDPGSLAVMRNIKNMLDPQGLLNKGALYGRI